MLAHLSDVINGKVAIGASAEVGRNFLVCKECRRVVAQWHLLMERGERERPGCRCGSMYVRPAYIPQWRAALWLIYGLVWRKWIRRKRLWDARLPVQLT